MTSVANVVTGTIALAGGRMIGRTRLQKTIYFLDQKGSESGATFYYYNFGPFSDDVAAGIIDGNFSGELHEKIEHRQIDGSPYSVFISAKDSGEIDKVGSLSTLVARDLIMKMIGVSSTVLEIAATIHWLIYVEGVQDWRTELLRRKGVKAEGGRMEKAFALLQELDLLQGDGSRQV